MKVYDEGDKKKICNRKQTIQESKSVKEDEEFTYNK